MVAAPVAFDTSALNYCYIILRLRSAELCYVSLCSVTLRNATLPTLQQHMTTGPTSGRGPWINSITAPTECNSANCVHV